MTSPTPGRADAGRGAARAVTPFGSASSRVFVRETATGVHLALNLRGRELHSPRGIEVIGGSDTAEFPYLIEGRAG